MGRQHSQEQGKHRGGPPGRAEQRGSTTEPVRTRIHLRLFCSPALVRGFDVIFYLNMSNLEPSFGSLIRIIGFFLKASDELTINPTIQ